MQRYDRLFSAGLPQFAVTVAATAIILASLSHAETITFNDLPTVPTAEGTSYALIPDGYQGLNWNQVYVGKRLHTWSYPSG